MNPDVYRIPTGDDIIGMLHAAGFSDVEHRASRETIAPRHPPVLAQLDLSGAVDGRR